MSFIKNYGILWHRAHVNWGSKGKGNGGTLLGWDSRSSAPIDFRHQAGVYVLYEGNDVPTMRVVYVGQAGRTNGDSLFARLKEHTGDHLWNRWSRFSWFGVFAVGKANTLVHTNITKRSVATLPAILDHLEGALITLMEPAFNKRGANWNGAMQYFQDEPESSDTVLEELRALRAEVELLGKTVKKLP